MAGLTVDLPAHLGNFQKPGQAQAMLEALQGPQRRALVSLDMVAWGGLVASRSQKQPFAEARERLESLPGLVKSKQAHAFQSILRTAPTQTSQEEVQLAEKLVELSVLSARQDPRADELALSLPPDYLTAYLDRRDQAHQLNRLACQQADQGSWQSLLLGIDDSRTEGWNVLEIARLQEILPANATIAPGTDEMALLQLVRLVGPVGAVQARWFPEDSADRIGRYEDRSMEGVVEAQARAAGVTLGVSPRQLWIYGPTRPQGEAGQQSVDEPSRSRSLIAQLRLGLEAGLQIALADVAHANGGDLRLLETLLDSGLAPRLVAYSAWNTAGNTLGTALAALALWPDHPTPEQDQQRLRFLVERLLDDGFYQASVRPGLSTSALQNAGPQVAETVQAELEARLARLVSAGFPTGSLQVGLPWDRVFEVRVEFA